MVKGKCKAGNNKNCQCCCCCCGCHNNSNGVGGGGGGRSNNSRLDSKISRLEMLPEILKLSNQVKDLKREAKSKRIIRKRNSVYKLDQCFRKVRDGLSEMYECLTDENEDDSSFDSIRFYSSTDSSSSSSSSSSEEGRRKIKKIRRRRESSTSSMDSHEKEVDNIERVRSPSSLETKSSSDSDEKEVNKINEEK